MKNVIFSIMILSCLLWANDELKMYDVKSGQFTMVTKNPDQNSIATVYFDDYGKKSRTEIKSGTQQNSSVGNGSMVLITNSGKFWTLFPESKTYMSGDINSEEEEDAEDWEDDVELDYNSEKSIGEETILGKSCKIFKTEDENGTTIKIWIWKKFVLKQEVKAEGMNSLMEITSLDLNSSVDSDMFEIPANYKENEGFGNLFKALQNAEEEEEEEDGVDIDDDDDDDDDSDDDSEDINKTLDVFKSLF